MTIRRSVAAFLLVTTALAVGLCERAKQIRRAEPEPLFIRYDIGGIWNPGYSLQVGYDHLVLESPRCPMAKRSPPDGLGRSDGFCVMRITEKQWQEFVRAMKPYTRHAIPFDPPTIIRREIPRPDGKPCKNEITDQNMIGITWFDQNGASYAGYYEGCDQEEHRKFYDELMAAPLVLPIKQLVEER